MGVFSFKTVAYLSLFVRCIGKDKSLEKFVGVLQIKFLLLSNITPNKIMSINTIQIH